jgi:hypothetical protein
VADASLEHLADDALGQHEESREVDADRTCIVVNRVVGKRLGDEDASVVDEGVDAPEALECPTEDPIDGGGIGDVSLDGKHGRIPDRLDRAGGSNDRPTSPPVLGDDACADALRTPVTMTTLWSRSLMTSPA